MTETKTIGITGMVGFMGSHLRDRLKREKDVVVPPFADSFFDDPAVLKDYVGHCNTIVHLAAMNRGDENEIYRINIELVEKLIRAMDAVKVRPHVLFSSSTQIDRNNSYGRSKKEGVRILEEWARQTGAPVSILVIPNVFGDKGRPFYNSVVATFCHQLTHEQEPQIFQDNQVNLIFINELTEHMWQCIQNPPKAMEMVRIPATSCPKVSEILALLKKFKDCYFAKMIVPAFANKFERDLYNTFIAYVEEPSFARAVKKNSDARGSLSEIVKQENAGQVFFSTTKPGITRGNHYHTRKMEKFCVVQGEAVIRLRRIGTDKVLEYHVSGDQPQSVEMPMFYAHSITNVGNTELLTVFWTNEIFDPNDTDTFYEEVVL